MGSSIPGGECKESLPKEQPHGAIQAWGAQGTEGPLVPAALSASCGHELMGSAASAPLPRANKRLLCKGKKKGFWTSVPQSNELDDLIPEKCEVWCALYPLPALKAATSTAQRMGRAVGRVWRMQRGLRGSVAVDVVATAGDKGLSCCHPMWDVGSVCVP